MCDLSGIYLLNASQIGGLFAGLGSPLLGAAFLNAVLYVDHAWI